MRALVRIDVGPRLSHGTSIGLQVSPFSSQDSGPTYRDTLAPHAAAFKRHVRSNAPRATIRLAGERSGHRRFLWSSRHAIDWRKRGTNKSRRSERYAATLDPVGPIGALSPHEANTEIEAQFLHVYNERKPNVRGCRHVGAATNRHVFHDEGALYGDDRNESIHDQ